ncbi:hypothetical protein CW304_18825 [Bacillus sp. UFRGS-B20]|nr:hypothetical protein CW304_18825 [Bacillus sp. UFRGS-B20]
MHFFCSIRLFRSGCLNRWKLFHLRPICFHDFHPCLLDSKENVSSFKQYVLCKRKCRKCRGKVQRLGSYLFKSRF